MSLGLNMVRALDAAWVGTVEASEPAAVVESRARLSVLLAVGLPDVHDPVAVIDLDARVATHEACRPQYAFHGLALRHRTSIYQLLGGLVRIQGSVIGEKLQRPVKGRDVYLRLPQLLGQPRLDLTHPLSMESHQFGGFGKGSWRLAVQSEPSSEHRPQVRSSCKGAGDPEDHVVEMLAVSLFHALLDNRQCFGKLADLVGVLLLQHLLNGGGERWRRRRQQITEERIK